MAMLEPETTPGTMGFAATWPRDRRKALTIAVGLWLAPFVVIAVMVALQPLKRTVTPLYHEAAANWWSGQSLYSGPQGMNYLPHFAVLFSPFHALPLPIAEVLWRLCSTALLALGLWQVIRGLCPDEAERAYFWATLLAMPLCLAAVRNGQANATFGGITLLAIAAALNKRWWWAAALMALATAVKPIGIVLMLLAPACYRPLLWRMPVAALALVVFPFLFAPPAYVWEQHLQMFGNLGACASVTQHRFADVNGILRTFGTELSPALSKLVRVVSGGLTLGLCWWGARKLRGPLLGLWLYALATGYLMLFNPMTESNSYVILAPALGAWAAFFLMKPGSARDRRPGLTLMAMGFTMGLLPNLVRPLFGNNFSLIWHPLMTIVFLGMLIYYVQGVAAAQSEPCPPPA